MTVIVGVAENGKVYIGGDSAAVGGYIARPTKLSKVFRVGEFLIGYTTSFRMGQLLEHELSVAPPTEGMTDLQYMVTVFVQAVRTLFKDKGFSSVSNNEEKGGFFLVGYRGELYEICSDYQVMPMAQGFNAVGQGDEFALATMHNLSHLPPVERIQKAIETAAHFCTGVMLPAVILEL